MYFDSNLQFLIQNTIKFIPTSECSELLKWHPICHQRVSDVTVSRINVLNSYIIDTLVLDKVQTILFLWVIEQFDTNLELLILSTSVM